MPRTPPRFLPLDVPPRLWVPCAVRPPFAETRLKTDGSVVGAGASLADDAAGAEAAPQAPRPIQAPTQAPLQPSGQVPAPTPLAPAAGRVAGGGRVTLLNAQEVPAALLETHLAGPADPFESSGPAASLEPPAGSSVTPLPSAAIRELLRDLHPSDLGASIDRLCRAGVWADRWTSPDLLGQLIACLRRPPDTILCSLLDPDPALGVNRACAESFPAEIVAAVAALARLTGAARAWLAVDAGADAAARAGVRQVAAEAAGDLRLVLVDNDYPQPDPTLLLYALTGRRLPPGRLPTDRGVLLLDAAAAAAVGRALAAGGPMLRVPFAVHDRTRAASDKGPDRVVGADDAGSSSDDVQGVTHFVTAAVGTPLRDVLAQLGITPTGGRGLELRAGGPLREVRVTGDCVVAGSELGVFVAPREPDVNPDPCIRCGWCAEGCPTRCQPAGLLEAAQADDMELARRYGLDACIECGICSYVCPSHLPLLHGIRTLRGERELGVEE